MISRIAGLAALAIFQASAIGLQHGTFRSQSTQGPAWTGTAGIVKEEFNVTVYSDYLDVQLDWEIDVGGSEPASYKNALEIVGNINFEANATVVGMLLWNGDKILKAKLKTKDQARKEYETVVDRSSAAPQHPRDPVILEWIREGNYDISIFPVAWGGFRKMRFRYLIPSAGGSMGFPHAFTDRAKYTLHPSNDIAGFDLTVYGSLNRVSVTDESLILNRSDYELRGYTWYYRDKPIPLRVTPIQNSTASDSTKASTFFVGNFFGNGYSGQAVHAFFRTPKGLAKGNTDAGAKRVYVTIRSGNDSCRKQITPDSPENSFDELKLLSRESVENRITWSVWNGDELQGELSETPDIIRMEDANQFARSLGNCAIYPLAKTMPFSLGSALGFIDAKYALVALEEDVLTAITAEKYLLTGVPTLNAEDIFPSKEDTAVPAKDWARARGYSMESLLNPNTVSISSQAGLPDGFHYEIRNGRIFIRVDGKVLQGNANVKVSIYSLSGRLAKTWSAPEISRGTFSWSPTESGLGGGSFAVKIELGSMRYCQPIYLR
ncbi:MAG: VIT domain-containing protein [Fibrobacteria bacterium]